MTALIETIEHAFIEARDESEIHGGEIRSDSVVEAITQYLKCDDDDRGSLEGEVDAAYTSMRESYGQDWPNASGDVAEEILVRLQEWVVSTP